MRTLVPFLLVVAAAAAEPVVYEAERATLAGGAYPFHDVAGFSGEGYVGGFWIDGASTTFAVEAPRDGRYRIALRYRDEPTPRALALSVDGQLVLRTVLPPIAPSGQTWRERAEVVELRSGRHAIAYAKLPNDGGVLIDRIAVAPTDDPLDPLYGEATRATCEAEDARLAGGLVPAGDEPGSSGTGYARGFWIPHASIVFTVEVPRAGGWRARLRYLDRGADAQTLTATFPGGTAAVVFAPTGSGVAAWRETSLSMTLPAGPAEIMLTVDAAGGGPIELDRLTLDPAP